MNVAAQWNFETNVNEATQIEAVSSHILRLASNFSLFYATILYSFYTIFILKKLWLLACGLWSFVWFFDIDPKNTIMLKL